MIALLVFMWTSTVLAAELSGRLIIVSSFPETVFGRFKSAFEAKNPSLKVHVRSKKTSAAISFIQEAKAESVDLLWLSAPDAFEVLKKSELVDIDGVMQRSGQMLQMQQQMQMLQEELKKVKGDLQTATREELHAKKRLEVEKFSSDLDKISNRAESATQLYKARIADVENNLMNSVSSVEQELAEELNEPKLGEMES